MKQVDKYFKNKIQHHESSVPQDMWDRIAPSLEEESKKTRPFLWFMFSIGLLILGGSVWMFTSKSATSTDAGINTPMSQLDSGIDMQESTLMPNEKRNRGTANQTINDVKNDAGLINAVNTANTIKEQKINTVIALQQSSKVNKANTVSKTVGVNTIAITNTSGIEIEGNILDIPSQLSNIKSDGKDMKLIVTKSYFDANSNQTKETTTTTLVHESRGLSEEVIDIELPIDNISDREIDKSDLGIKLFNANVPKCPSFVNKRLGLFVDGYVSHDLTHHQYSGDSEYSILREMSESSIYGYGAGIRFSFFLSDGFGLRSGLNYSQVNQKFEVDDPNATDTKIQIVQEIIVDANGDSTLISREEIIEVGGRRQITNHNSYHFLDIPVLLFYEFGSANSKFYYSVNAGAYVNLLFNQSGKYLSNTGSIIDFAGDDENPNPFKSTAGVSLYASFGVHYMLTDNIDLIVEPHFLRQVGSLTRNNYPLRQRLTTFGVNTGLRYKF